MMRCAIRALATLFVISTAACGQTVSSVASQVPRAAAPAISDATLTELEKAATRQRLADVLATPELQRAMREVSSGFTQGIIEGLSSDAMAAQMELLSTRMTDVLMKNLGDKIEQHLAPAVTNLARASVEAAMRQALSTENIRASQEAASAVAATGARSALRAVAEDIPTTLGPAMERMLTETMGPAIERVIREHVLPSSADLANAPGLQAALGTTSRTIAREAVYGSNEALAALAETQPKQGLLARVAALFGGATWIAWLGLLGAALVALWFSARIVRLRTERNRTAREHELHETILAALSTALQAEGKPWADEWRESLRAQLAQARAASEDAKMPQSVLSPRKRIRGAHSRHVPER